MRELRPHQQFARQAVAQSIAKGSRRPLIQMPTGAGKTLLAASFVRGAQAKGRRAIFTVPAIDLVDQTVREFWAEGIRDVGVMQASHPLTNPSRPIQVATVQTLMRREIPLTDLVIVDEAHKQTEAVNRWLLSLTCPVIGLSATPWSKGLGKVYDDLIIATTTAELIEAGYLSPFRVFAPSHPDLSDVRTQAGDYREDDLGRIMGQPKITADIVSTWLAKGEGRPTLAFCVDRAHAKAVQAAFEAAGVRCGYVDGNSDREERDRVRKAFASGDTPVVANVGVLTTGVDWDVRCIILARPTKSEILYTQIVGRGLRTADGKSDCLILDHSDTTLKLGFVTDIGHDKLCDGKPNKSASRKKPPAPLECGKCSYVRPKGVHECPACGFAPVRKSEVETLDGELRELGATRVSKVDRAERRRVYAELRRYFIDRGKKEGAAFYAFQERYGCKPDWAWKQDAPAPFVSPEVAGYMTSRLIAFAKSREASGETSGRRAA